MSLKNKNVLLGITGGIAAYKTPDLVRKLAARGANVRVVLTNSAREFVSPLSLQAVSGNSIHDDLLDTQAEAAMGHIELAKWADTLLIAPATANCIAKLAHGLADDLLSTLYLATTAQVVLAPAMNQQMWAAQATQQNLNVLIERGVLLFGPDEGEQACGDLGAGRMMEPIDIAEALDALYRPEAASTSPLTGKRIVITAGPTIEAIDPVRYISNHSSGKMGYAIATAAKSAGADVVLVSGPVNLATPEGVKRIDCNSAAEMHAAVMDKISSCDIFIATAAVADYRATDVASQKIKKHDDKLTLTLTKNPDILRDVASMASPPFTLGFAAETQRVAEYATKKMVEKKLDMIAANDVAKTDIGFNSDNNALTLFWSGGQKQLPKTDKLTLAKRLIEALVTRYNEKESARN